MLTQSTASEAECQGHQASLAAREAELKHLQVHLMEQQTGVMELQTLLASERLAWSQRREEQDAERAIQQQLQTEALHKAMMELQVWRPAYSPRYPHCLLHPCIWLSVNIRTCLIPHFDCLFYHAISYISGGF